MSHAVYEGIKQGYIGAFHRLTSDFFDASNGKKLGINQSMILK